MIKVLDHGYVKLTDVWGFDEKAIIEAARQSTQGSFRGWNEDRGLLGYLYRNKHSTPFEFAGMTIEVQAPIFVFREWHRHRTQSYNEMSARYAPLPDLYYLPDVFNVHERVLASGKNKQAGTVAGIKASYKDIAEWLSHASDLYVEAERVYQEGLKMGLPKEVARIVMPVGHYSRMRASANLRNWLAFVTLRAAPEAQWEIRQYAEAVADIMRGKFPETMRLFDAEH